MKLNAESELTN